MMYMYAMFQFQDNLREETYTSNKCPSRFNTGYRGPEEK